MSVSTPLPGRRPRTTDALVAAAVLLIELGATYGSIDGDPFAPVDGWGATRAVDPLAFAAVIVGCAVLYWRRTLPVTTLAVTAAAYCLFLLRDHELGMFLAPMVALYTAANLGRARLWAVLAGAAAMAASLVWVHARTDTIPESGVTLLSWVAFAAVIGVFFAGSFLAGELVRCHRLLAAHQITTTGGERPSKERVWKGSPANADGG